MDKVIIIAIGFVAFLYFIIMIPLQYSYISAMKERHKKSGKTHNELYEEMSFEEQQLHYNLQGHLINLPSTLVAMFIYKIRHRKT